MSNDNSVEIKFIVDAAAALAAWQKQQNAIAATERRLDKLAASGNKAGNALSGGASKALGTLRDCAVAFTGIGGAVGGILALANQLRAELDAIKNRRQASANLQVSLAPKLDDAIRNVGGQLTGPEVRVLAKKVASESRQTPEKALEVLSAAWAAGAPENPDAAKATGPVAVQVLKTLPNESSETQAEAASVVQGIMKFEGLDAEEAMGFFLKMGEGHLSRDPGKLAKHAVPSAVKGVGFGNSLAYSGAMTNVFAKAMLDTDGAVSAHSANVFESEIKERFPNMTAQEAIAHMRANPKDAQAYRHGGMIGGKKFDAAKVGEGASIPTVEGIIGLNADPRFSKLAGEIDKEAQRIGGKANWQARQKEQLAANRSTHEQILAEQKRAVESSKQLRQMSENEAAAEGVASEGFDATMAASDLPQWHQWLNSQGHFWDGSGAGGLAAEMERLADREDKTIKQTVHGDWGLGGATTELIPKANVTAEQLIKARNYRTAAASVRELEAERKAASIVSGESELVKPEMEPLNDTVPIRNLRSANDDLRETRQHIKHGGTLDAGGLEAARQEIGQAQHALQDARGWMTPEQFERMAQIQEDMINTNKALIKSLEKNTQVTADNSKQPTGGRTTGLIPGPSRAAAFNRGRS